MSRALGTSYYLIACRYPPSTLQKWATLGHPLGTDFYLGRRPPPSIIPQACEDELAGPTKAYCGGGRTFDPALKHRTAKQSKVGKALTIIQRKLTRYAGKLEECRLQTRIHASYRRVSICGELPVCALQDSHLPVLLVLAVLKDERASTEFTSIDFAGLSAVTRLGTALLKVALILSHATSIWSVTRQSGWPYHHHP